MVNRERLIRTTQELIQIPSPTGEEREIGKYVKAELEAEGINAERDEVGNVYAVVGEGERSIMLNAHLDTVPPQGYKEDPYGGIVKGNKIIGLGASDCKSGVASMLEIARSVNENELGGRLILAFSVAEEGVLKGKKYPKGSMYAVERYSADGCVVLEPTMYNGVPRISGGCRGRMILEIDVKGKSAHSSRPKSGKNAIEEAMKLVKRLKDHELLKGRYFGDALEETLSIVRIESNSPATNIIPSLCSITVDYRTLPGREGVKEEIKRAVRDSGVKADVRIPYFSPGYVLDAKSRFLQIFYESVKRSFDMNPKLMVALGRADSEYFYRKEIPAVIFGPGENDQCHKPDEYVLIPGMVKATNTVLGFVKSFLGRETDRVGST